MYRGFLTTVIGILGAVGCALPAPACNGPPRAPVDQLFARADVVVLAVVDTVQQTPAKTYITEEVRFTVLESWKGSKRPGDVVLTRSVISPGSCAVSALNDPMWLEDTSRKAVKLSGVWVLYFEGKEPYELTVSASQPLEAGGAGDLAALYRISSKASGASP